MPLRLAGVVLWGWAKGAPGRGMNGLTVALPLRSTRLLAGTTPSNAFMAMS